MQAGDSFADVCGYYHGCKMIRAAASLVDLFLQFVCNQGNHTVVKITKLVFRVFVKNVVEQQARRQRGSLASNPPFDLQKIFRYTA